MSNFGNRLKNILNLMKEKSKLVGEYWSKTPTTKFILMNTGIYIMWKINLIPQEFMVKHFSAQRWNIQNGRIHTLITSSFSHTSLFSYLIDILMIGMMGKGIQANWGNKHIYWLYGVGALFGGISSVAFKPPSPYIEPSIGCQSVTAALITFIGIHNPSRVFIFITIPIPIWVLLTFMGIYSLAYDPEKKIFSGMTAGVTVYQMTRVKFI